MYIITYVHVLFYIFKFNMYKLNFTYICGSMKTGLIDYDNFDETLTFEHLLLLILYRYQTI